MIIPYKSLRGREGIQITLQDYGRALICSASCQVPSKALGPSEELVGRGTAAASLTAYSSPLCLWRKSLKSKGTMSNKKRITYDSEPLYELREPPAFGSTGVEIGDALANRA